MRDSHKSVGKHSNWIKSSNSIQSVDELIQIDSSIRRQDLSNLCVFFRQKKMTTMGSQSYQRFKRIHPHTSYQRNYQIVTLRCCSFNSCWINSSILSQFWSHPCSCANILLTQLQAPQIFMDRNFWQLAFCKVDGINNPNSTYIISYPTTHLFFPSAAQITDEIWSCYTCIK